MEYTLDFIAGCLGGCAGVLVGHPFDTVKVRLQLQSSKNPLYRGTFDCFKSIVEKESSRGLYKGVTSPLYSLAFINAIVFGVQGNVLRRMQDPSSLRSHFLAGSLAGFVQSGISCPMELVKTQMQMQGLGEKHSTKRVYSNSRDAVKQIYGAEGFRGIYRGMASTVVREIPSFGVYFITYEYLCRLFTPQGAGYCSTPGLLVAGGLAGCNSWICTYPVDVIKSRMQGDGVWANGKLIYQYKGYLDCLRQSMAEQGYRVLFRGFSTTIIRAFPTNAATFTVVTLCLRYLKPNETEEERRDTLERSTMIAQLEG